VELFHNKGYLTLDGLTCKRLRLFDTEGPSLIKLIKPITLGGRKLLKKRLLWPTADKEILTNRYRTLQRVANLSPSEVSAMRSLLTDLVQLDVVANQLSYNTRLLAREMAAGSEGVRRARQDSQMVRSFLKAAFFSRKVYRLLDRANQAALVETDHACLRSFE
jgi:DNA mismatch repair ATPase MutS